MKTNNMNELKKQARQLVLISKQQKLIRPHTEAFKDFPVEEEKHTKILKNNNLLRKRT